jgi:hypothetical protein
MNNFWYLSNVSIIGEFKKRERIYNSTNEHLAVGLTTSPGKGGGPNHPVLHGLYEYTVKKVRGFLVPRRDVTYQTAATGRE